MGINYERCKKCGEFAFLDNHHCKPEWEAIQADYHDEEDCQITYGYDAESAALKFAQDNFALWDHPEEMQIWVRKPGETDWNKFEITVASVPEFSATEIKSNA